MDIDIRNKLAKEFNLSNEIIEIYERLFSKKIKPTMELKYLSHLLSTVEDIINTKLKDKFKNLNEDILKLIDRKNVRLFTILLTPMDTTRRATIRYYTFGTTIVYSTRYSDKYRRILIAHELGHIINKKLLEITDNENTANLFSFMVMNDKNKFYKEECKKFIFTSDVQILNDIKNICIDQKI